MTTVTSTGREWKCFKASGLETFYDQFVKFVKIQHPVAVLLSPPTGQVRELSREAKENRSSLGTNRLHALTKHKNSYYA